MFLFIIFIEIAEQNQILKTNPVWQHFMQPTPDKARCNICKILVSMGAEKAKTKNTSNMWSHLKRRHLKAYNEAQKVKDDRAAASTSAVSSTQPNLVQMFDKEMG